MEVSEHDGGVKEISEKLEKSLSMETEDNMDAYHRLIQDAKDVFRQGDTSKALEFFKSAYNIHQSQKLETRIKKIEELIAQNDSEEEDEEFVNVNNSGLMLFKDLYDKLYDYQRDGVAFMYSLYRDGRKGGILADDMGLGKTIQVISFLSGMYDNELVKHALLVMPTSLITNWTKEFAKWTPGMRVKEFHGTSKGERTRNLERVQRRGGVVITTYTMLMNNWQQLSSYHGREFTWDYMILDEAHKIKTSSTKTAKSASAIPSKHRVLLTGTPVQNNLKEMWALFDFACQGTLLGTAKTFKTEYENPITRAREKDATPGEKVLGTRMSENLMAIIKPYFLRRTKAEVQKNKMSGTHQGNKDGQVQNPQKDSGAVMPTLTRKNDLIVWTYLSSAQKDIYRQFISLDHIKELLMTSRSPLAELTILKKLCDHPRLLSAAAIAKLGLDESTAESQQSDDTETDAHSIANVSDDTLISESGKLVFLFALLERLREEGHRTLVFAHYRKVLDILERILVNRGFKVMRLDGTITQIAERERRITKFQTDKRYSVFLLTTQVGGVGITLTAADRVVIYDPSWNPATDAQAVDRAYRIGQTENVVIYRLITCGTVEEKIYRRQVFKDSLIRQNTGDKKNPFRYFSKQELKELFTLEDTRSSSTQLQLQALHSRHRRTDPELDEHIAHLHAMEMFGISDHDLMFSLDVNHDEAPEDQEAHHYIEGRVQKAQELMKAESELQMQLTENMASSTEPAWLRQPVDNNRERSREKKPRNPRPSPSYPQHDSNFNRSPVVVDLDQSSSGMEGGQQNLSDHVIDLTADESNSEEQPAAGVSQDELPELNLDSRKLQSVKQERSSLGVADASPQDGTEESLVTSEPTDAAVQELIDESQTSADASVQELLDESQTSEAADASVQEPIDESQTSADASVQELLDESQTSEAADASVQELIDESQTSADASVQELLDESQTSEAADASVQEPLDESQTSEAADASVQEPIDESQTSEAADASVQEPIDESQMSAAADAAAGDGSQSYVTADDEDEQQLNGTSHSTNNSMMDFGPARVTPLQNKRLSVLHASNSSFKGDTSHRVSGAGLESFEGNFNLQLEYSDVSSEGEVLDHQETEAEERKLLSQLQMDGSFDVNKSLSERQHREALGQSLNVSASEMDESLNESFVATKKKRAAVIYDSDEDEEEEKLDNPFQVLGASTPLRRRKSVGGNTSVASNRSLIQSIVDDMDDEDEGDEDDISDEAEEDDIIGSTNELQLEETTGETLNTEGEEEEEDCSESADGVDASAEEMCSNLEESASEPELASSERMDQCTVDAGVETNGMKDVAEDESYDSLVSRGREVYSEGKLEDALGFFLSAIDIKPGDPEIQLMTIQLYRQLSQRR
ncbi:DNA excision repair protein ERCC-6-like [Micropterus salmoides]|uniref:DNA excision repair protein ERCC-6-like n=1 Tax=Micropterus salmoides TaxID=27706 RepID=UPI0018EC0DC1|nr:DNA excision repair protein ERCC-6-like [Micropterus salmoides]